MAHLTDKQISEYVAEVMRQYDRLVLEEEDPPDPHDGLGVWLFPHNSGLIPAPDRV